MDSTITDDQSPEYFRQELAHFSYKISHDLQAPLRSVIGFSNLVLRSVNDRLTTQEKSDLEMVISSAQHAQKLIEALLEYSRLITSPPPLTKIDANTVLEEVLLSMEKKIAEQHATIHHTTTLPTVIANPKQLYFLFSQLLCNAIKFHKLDEPPVIHITVEPYTNNKYWLFRVIDNGIGIDSKHHDIVFDMFRKLHNDEEYEGMGIGLAFVKKIIEQHHGTIGIDSSLGKGASIWFTLQSG